MKYMIIRIKDERSSDICKAIEEKAMEEGGLEFPFTIGNYTYDEDTIERAFLNAGNYYTDTFHENCRSTIVPLSENSNLMYPGKELDDLDRMMLTEGALAESAMVQMSNSGEVSEAAFRSFLDSRHMSKLKNMWQYITRRVQVVRDSVTNYLRNWL